MVAPDAIGLIIFVLGPTLLSLSLGFFSVSGFGEYEFIGLGNYRRMAGDPLYWQSVKVTLLYVVTLVPALYVTGLALALLVQRGDAFSAVVRTLLFMPQTVSLVVVGLIWQVLLVDKIGARQSPVLDAASAGRRGSATRDSRSTRSCSSACGS